MKCLFAALCLCMSLAFSVTAQNIVELASGQEDLTTLVSAIQAAGLTETLQGDGPFTVFAPSNDAWAALPEGKLEALMMPENKDELVQILTYHVVTGQMLAADITGGKSATVQGEEVDILVADSGVTVNEATVTTADVQAANGVVHIIDRVIMPPSRLKN